MDALSFEIPHCKNRMLITFSYIQYEANLKASIDYAKSGKMLQSYKARRKAFTALKDHFEFIEENIKVN